MAGNYPAGVTAGHPYFNPPDHSHEHEWFAKKNESPIFEDGAAIFVQDCQYAEGRYGDGWQCEEVRRIRCDVDRIIRVREDAPNVTYLVSEENNEEEWGHIEVVYEEMLDAVDPYDPEIQCIDPANGFGDGYVEVVVDDFVVIYRE